LYGNRTKEEVQNAYHIACDAKLARMESARILDVTADKIHV
jgi:hypothetical protein